MKKKIETFERVQWAAGVAKFCYKPFNGDIPETKQLTSATACFTNGMTNHYDTSCNSLGDKAYYKFTLETDETKSVKRDKSNLCLLGADEITYYLDYLNTIFDFKYRLNKEDSKYILEVIFRMNHHKGDNRIHFWLVTSIRYLYEFPQNVILRDALKLKKLDVFKEETIHNLYLLVVNSFPTISYHYGRIVYDPYHSIPVSIPASNCQNIGLSDSVLKDTLIKLSSFGRLNDTYPVVRFKSKVNKIGGRLGGGEPTKLLFSREYWENETMFKSRVLIYLKNVKIIKEENLQRRYHYPELEKLFEDYDKYSEDLIKEYSKDITKNELEHKVKLADNYNKLHPRGADGRFIKKVQPQVVITNELHPRGKDGKFIKKSTIK